MSSIEKDRTEVTLNVRHHLLTVKILLIIVTRAPRREYTGGTLFVGAPYQAGCAHSSPGSTATSGATFLSRSVPSCDRGCKSPWTVVLL